jgi:hypothetical protein
MGADLKWTERRHRVAPYPPAPGSPHLGKQERVPTELVDQGPLPSQSLSWNLATRITSAISKAPRSLAGASTIAAALQPRAWLETFRSLALGSPRLHGFDKTRSRISLE